MATIEESLFYKLSNTAAITAIAPATRIYYITLDDSTALPAVSYQRTGTSRDYTLNEAQSMTEATFQVDAWSRTNSEMVSLATEIRDALDGFRGIVQGVTIERILQVNEFDLPEAEGAIFRRYQSFRVIYQEP